MSSIIVTIGPKSIDPKVIRKIKLAGADRFRINLSHSNEKSLKEYFAILSKEGITPAIDTQGAQLRINNLSSQNNYEIGQLIEIRFTNGHELKKDDKNIICLNHKEAYSQINIGDKLKVDFNGLALEVLSKKNFNIINSRVIASGNTEINKALDVSNKNLNLSILTEFDKKAIDYAISRGCNEVYASFISNANQVNEVRKQINKNIRLISKIETSLGVANIEEILEVSDEILIDRGDLSREISIASIPIAVFRIIELANKKNKPVNIATNVLDSMMNSSIPSRAEISDIYSNLSAGAHGIVLAAEVAIGGNPISSTALLKYLIDLFNNHKNGLHGIGRVLKPKKELIGEALFNWL